MKTAKQNTAITNIEKALKIPSIQSLTNKNIVEFDRIYFGHEFCERLLPDLDQLKRAIDIIKKSQAKFSLLTPSVTEYGLKSIKSLVSLLREDDEVIINDYGVLNMVETEFKNPILIGRILSRIVIPTLVSLKGNDISLHHYLSILGQKVQGVEVDYFNASTIDSHLAEILSISLYKGPLVWTTTKRCAFNTQASTLQKFCACKQECLLCQAVIENVASKKTFLLSGNTIFGQASDAPEISNNDVFKRIVFELKTES